MEEQLLTQRNFINEHIKPGVICLGPNKLKGMLINAKTIQDQEKLI